MQSKSLLIAIAAFAVTTTGVQAYGTSKILSRAGLTTEQREAIMQAHELRSEGDFEAARDLLVSAGIDDVALRSLHRAQHAVQDEMRQALEDGNYEAFLAAVADTPLADIITTKADFEQFREAHELRHEGEWEAAQEIFADLGVEEGMHGRHMHRKAHILTQLTEDQRDAFFVAKQANDRATMQAILDEAGVDFPSR